MQHPLLTCPLTPCPPMGETGARGRWGWAPAACRSSPVSCPQATLHELLHALGFSGWLFRKWRDCSSGPSGKEGARRVYPQREWLLWGNPFFPDHLSLPDTPPPFPFSAREHCSPRHQVTVRDEWGQLLLTTPAVSRALARHLGVQELPLGVPLEEEVRTPGGEGEKAEPWAGCSSTSGLEQLPHRGEVWVW